MLICTWKLSKPGRSPVSIPEAGNDQMPCVHDQNPHSCRYRCQHQICTHGSRSAKHNQNALTEPYMTSVPVRSVYLSLSNPVHLEVISPTSRDLYLLRNRHSFSDFLSLLHIQSCKSHSLPQPLSTCILFFSSARSPAQPLLKLSATATPPSPHLSK